MSGRRGFWWLVVLLWAVFGIGWGPGGPGGGGRQLALATDAPTDYLVQIEFALANLDGQMLKLARRALGEDPLRRCAFGVERRKYVTLRDELRAKLALARRSRADAARLRVEVENAFAKVRKAYERAVACYR
ncbi:MAG: hypothetical protein GXP50_01865 [Deltaproteobacteria bacterium]|nr:hypothetical protein [Deltaproteobacteria bacterium]